MLFAHTFGKHDCFEQSAKQFKIFSTQGNCLETSKELQDISIDLICWRSLRQIGLFKERVRVGTELHEEIKLSCELKLESFVVFTSSYKIEQIYMVNGNQNGALKLQ